MVAERARLQDKELYGLAEIARATGLERRKLVRRLVTAGVRIIGRGPRCARVIERESLQNKLPELWRRIGPAL